jgi:psiF repeat
MKVVTSLAFALAALLSASAFAADKAPADKLTPQQQKLSDCAKDAHAKSLKGDEYKSYMSTCTKGGATAAPAAAKATTPAKTVDANGRPIGRNGKTKTPATATAAETSADATASKTEPAAVPNPWVATPGNTKAVNAQQQKMKTCASDAKTKGLKGNDRRTYMSTCLKGDASAPAATTPTPAPAPAPAKKTGA